MLPFIWLLLISPIATNPQKCYLNHSSESASIAICPQNKPFCCFDLIEAYSCCEERQILSVIKNGSIIFGAVLLWTVIIALFFCLFVEIQSIDDRIEDKNQLEKEFSGKAIGDKKEKSQLSQLPETMSTFFPVPETKPLLLSVSKVPLKTPQKLENENTVKTNEKETPEDKKAMPSISKAAEERKKSTPEVTKPDSCQQSKVEKEVKPEYKPAWGQFDKSHLKSSERIQFKDKQKSPRSPDSIKALLIEESDKIPKSSSKKEEVPVVKDKPPLVTENEQKTASDMQKRVKDMQKLLNKK